MFLSQAVVSAAPIAVSGGQSPTGSSAFSLDFGAFGGVASARITQTQFALEVDAAQGQARFAAYHQLVEPLTLPGGFSTGNIQVEVVAGSSAGTFDDLTGEFNTSEEYAIHFDGDLSAFGLTSPVILPSTSAGRVLVRAVEGGSVLMDWRGTSELPNPFDPNSTIAFAYTCSVDAVFAASSETLVQLALIPNVINLGLARGVENRLLRPLESASDAIDAGRDRPAARSLNNFADRVEAQRGSSLSDEEADGLISDAQGAIDLLGSALRDAPDKGRSR